MLSSVPRWPAGSFIRAAALLGGLFCLWQASSAGRWNTEARATASTVAPLGVTTQSIASLRVGQRVLADNPELPGLPLPDSTIEPTGWRLVRLEMEKPNGGRLDIELLRPVEWFLAHSLELVRNELRVHHHRPLTVAPAELLLCEVLLGRTLALDLPELGASGPARVTAIEPCPEIERANRPGRRVITGTFQHSAGNLLDLYVEGESKPLGVTDNHPFWSEDRLAFVPAGELRAGERLRTVEQAITQVTRITPRIGPPVPVYNLEVDAEHVYFVGNGGVLVHNTYHHSIPKYLGGLDGQALSDIPINAHIELHRRLRQGWNMLGFPPEGGRPGSREQWRMFLTENEGTQQQAFGLLSSVTRQIDDQYSTRIFDDLLQNLQTQQYYQY